MKINNPFTLNVYSGPKYFCDRKQETAQMISAIHNRRNLTLVSHRRLGKSGLIKHVFHQLQHEKKMKLFYIDIMDTENLSGFVNLLAKEVIGKIDGQTLRLIKSFGEMVKSLRPKISVDPLTGNPEIEIDVQFNASPEKSLSEIFSYLQKQEKHIVIAFDEFQQILEYPEKNMEAILRKHIQQLSRTSFIFSGSQKHMLTTMFSDYGRPFYQSTTFLNLGKIEEKTYASFIAHWFTKDKREITSDALSVLFKLCRNHTYYVQYLCNILYGLPKQHVEEKTVIETLLHILEERSFVYYNYKKLLTGLQFQLLEAIAKEEGVVKPTSKHFIGKYKLGTPSSVKTALTALFKKEMIFQEESTIKIYDVFFSIWLNRRMLT